MTVTSYTFPGTTAQEAREDNKPWVNTDNVKIDDGIAATCEVSKNIIVDWLRVSNFSFSIPAGATIDGIELQIKRKQNWPDTALQDGDIFLRKTSGRVGSNYADPDTFGSAYETITYGGATDLWGTSWNVADINSSDFGLDVGLDNGSENEDAYVDFIKIRIYYTEAAGGTGISKVKIGGTFVEKPAMVKIGGTFVEKIMKVRVGGTFQ